MKQFVIILVILSLICVPVIAHEVEPGEIPGNTEETFPADLPVFFSEPDFSVVMQPSSKSASVGKTVNFSVLAVGDNLEYAWFYSKDGGNSWFRSSAATQGYNTNTLSVVATAVRDGFMYRCMVSNDTGMIVTSAATLTVVTDGSYVSDWDASDVLLLFSHSVAAAGSWFNAILTATGMSGFYLTIMTIMLVISFLLGPLLATSLGGLSDAVRKPRKHDSGNEG